MTRLAKAVSAFTPGRSASPRRAVFSLLLVALLAAALAPGASAAPKSIGGFIGGSGGVDGGGLFTQPRDVAVYRGTDGDPATDKTFVVEGLSNTSRVQRLTASGEFDLMWGKDVIVSGAPGDTGLGYEICTAALSGAASCKRPGVVGALKGEFNQPSSIAVDQTNGWVYVLDRLNHRVQKFDLAGNFILMFGRNVNLTAVNAALPQAQRELCTQASGDTCQAGVESAEAGAINGGTGVPKLEVVQASGDVFVADPSANGRRLSQFDSSGGFIRAWGYGVDTGATNQFQVCTAASTCQAGVNPAVANANGSFAASSPANVAVDSQGVVYATDTASGTVAQRIIRFDSDLAPACPGSCDATAALLDPIEPTTGTVNKVLLPGPLAGGVPNGIEVDPDHDGAGPDEESLLAVRDPNAPTTDPTIVQELDVPTQAGELPADAVTVVDTHAFAAAAVNGGIAANSSLGTVYLPISLATVNFPACGLAIPGCTNGTGLIVLSAGGAALAASTGVPAPVGSSTATLNGSVDVNGSGSYRFQLARGGEAFANVGGASLSGGAGIPVSKAVNGLVPNSVYRVRLIASKINSLTTFTSITSNESVFVTEAIPPVATTLGASARTDTRALLSGSVDSKGSETTYQFQYGTTAALGTSVPVPAAPAGSAAGAQVVAQQLIDLTPGQTYHFRLCATNAQGSHCGATKIFETKPSPTPATPENRAYELVSPADKLGGQGVGNWYTGAGSAGGVGVAAHSGERFAVQGRTGSILLDGAFSFGNDWAFAERTPQGWKSHSPITRGGYGEQAYRLINIGAATEDFSTLQWNSAGILKLFPEQETWPEVGEMSFVSDWAGRWEALAPTDPSQVVPGPGGINDLRQAQAPAAPYVAIATAKVRGLAGPADPTNLAWPEDVVAGARNVYLDDVSAGPSDTFPGAGVRSLVNVCAGSAGVDRTLIPSRLASGKLGAQECPAANPGRFEHPISERGGALPNTGIGGEFSADGSRLFFLSPDPGVGGSGEVACDPALSGASTKCPAQLYVHQRQPGGDVVTRWISRSEVTLANGATAEQDATLMSRVAFEGASANGDKVFFRTASPLTADDPNGAVAVPGGVTTGTPNAASWDLYMYDFPDAPGADPGNGDLVRISGGPGGTGDCNVTDQGIDTAALRFVSENGGRAYFTCAGLLPGVAAPDNGTLTEPGGTPATTATANLYLYEAGSWRFVAQLPRSINETIGACATHGGAAGSFTLASQNSTSKLDVRGNNCVQGSADGAFLTFWTAGRLTADDPDSTSADIYAFDAEAEELIRITAPQGGSGSTYLCNPGDAVGAPLQCFGDGGIAGGQGAAGPGTAALGIATDPSTPGDRIAFFQSKSRLVPEDEDSVYDVYEWRNGKLSLVSTGTSPTDGAFYKGTDVTGTNVYFATLDRLSWQDFDAALDVYTARAGGGIPEPPSPPACSVLADGCQAAPAPVPSPAAAGSAAFSGSANVVEPSRPRCSKGKVRRGKRCVKKGVKKAKSSRAAGKERRAGK